MKLFVATSIIVTLLAACQNKSAPATGNSSQQEEPYFKPGYIYVQQTPDSLRSPEQRALIKKIGLVIYENVSVQDNKFVFNLSEEEFVALGIPVQYYDLIQKDMINNNKFVKENNINNLDSILRESNKQIKDSLGKGS